MSTLRFEHDRENLVSSGNLAPSPRSLNEPPRTVECDVNENAEPEGALPTQSTSSKEPTPLDNVVRLTERPMSHRLSCVRRPVVRYSNNIYT